MPRRRAKSKTIPAAMRITARAKAIDTPATPVAASTAAGADAAEEFATGTDGDVTVGDGDGASFSLTVKVIGSDVSVPAAFAAEILNVTVPAVVGVPDSSPVVVSNVSPAGRMSSAAML